jgi:hypothetical protein
MKSLEHTCFSQHLNEVKPLKCTCRKRITLAEATKMVEKGFAQWLILSTTYVTGMEPCPICQNAEIKKNCQHCKGAGEIEKTYPIRKHGNDIVLVTTGSPDDKGMMVYKPVLSKQTPRVATIEEEHILRAYCSNNKDEQERIDEYGLMILQARIDMGIGVEPPDDPKTGTGRNCDYGRSPFARISDERTSLGIGKIGARIAEGYKQINSDGKDGEE